MMISKAPDRSMLWSKVGKFYLMDTVVSLTAVVKRVCVTSLLIIFMCISAIAQITPDIEQQAKSRLETFSGLIEKIRTQIEQDNQTDITLVEARAELETLRRQVLKFAAGFGPRSSEINTRLTQLGHAPKDDEPAEPQETTKEREMLAEEKASINRIIGDAEAVSIGASRLMENIGDKRRQLFADALTKRYNVTELFSETMRRQLAVQQSRFEDIVYGWYRRTLLLRSSEFLWATFFILIVAIAIFVFGARLLKRVVHIDPDEADPTYLDRLSLAFWTILTSTLSVVAFFNAIYFIYLEYGIVSGRIAQILAALLQTIGIVYFVHRLARSILSPGRKQWRLIPVCNRQIGLLIVLVTLTAFFTMTDALVAAITEALNLSIELTIVRGFLTSILAGLMLVIIGQLRPHEDATGNASAWPKWVRYTLYFMGGIPIATALIGYVGFARFAIQQIVVTGAILITLYIGFLSARALGDRNAFTQSSLGAYLKDRFELSETRIDQLALVASLVAMAAVVTIGLPLVALAWGFQFEDLRVWIATLAGNIQFGSFSFSLIGIITGVVVFFVAYMLSRWFRTWLDVSILARARVDPGVRNSARTMMGYVGVTLAAIIGIAAAGIDLSSLALIAGGLSLGIGFGLQNIVSNFVSGLILLIERPFKAGDWIEAGTIVGTVKRVNVRATEIETFQRQTIILPNSELINSAVGNWTHRNTLGRVDTPVGVSYSADPKQIEEILLTIAQEHPLVLRNPEPYVAFVGFGDSSLDFSLRVYLADIGDILTVQSEFRYQILETFRARNIEIPFPQSDVHLRVVQPENAESGTETAKLSTGPHQDLNIGKSAEQGSAIPSEPPAVDD